jgi:hypothetical protein
MQQLCRDLERRGRETEFKASGRSKKRRGKWERKRDRWYVVPSDDDKTSQR